jgi:hypothetical protein
VDKCEVKGGVDKWCKCHHLFGVLVLKWVEVGSKLLEVGKSR